MYYVFNIYWTYVISILGLLGANVITRFLYIFKNNCDYAPNLSCFYFSHNVISLHNVSGEASTIFTRGPNINKLNSQ
jgi:hypothetical protein